MTLLCFFIGHKFVDWYDQGRDQYDFCLRCGKAHQ